MTWPDTPQCQDLTRLFFSSTHQVSTGFVPDTTVDGYIAYRAPMGPLVDRKTFEGDELDIA